jgi:hypothetical protein
MFTVRTRLCSCRKPQRPPWKNKQTNVSLLKKTVRIEKLKRICNHDPLPCTSTYELQFKPFDCWHQSDYLLFGFGKHSMWGKHWVFELFCLYFVPNIKQEDFKSYKFHIYRISPLPTVFNLVLAPLCLVYNMVHCPPCTDNNVGTTVFTFNDKNEVPRLGNRWKFWIIRLV